ncbi:molybdopterin molybdotransferase MoeA, partial [bacterium]|nr:molybdopterin molybdotransferase MoeA [bacterium]
MISVLEAQKRIFDCAVRLSSQTIPVEHSLSYVLVNDVTADRPIPPFNRVAMDGFAVKSSDFRSPTVKLKLRGKIQTGVETDLIIDKGEAVQIMTGAPCPEGADAVVKVENSQTDGEWVTLTEPKMVTGLNIAPKGEDAAQGKVLIKAGTALTTAGIAICASVGIAEVEVYRKPTIRIISTGTEIIPPGQTPLPHQIRDCNSFTLRAMSSGLNIKADFLGIGEDDTGVISQMIKEGLKADILILSGGVSMGEFDYVPKLLAKNGVETVFHHVKVKPGKPLWFGKKGSKTYVFGLPGNPVSVQTCFRVFVEPLIRKLAGNKTPESISLKLPLAEDVVSKTQREHYMPGCFHVQDGKTHIKRIPIRGSG